MSAASTDPCAQCDIFSAGEPLCATLDRIGVPRTAGWRTLILYMRGLDDSPFLTDTQKQEIKTLLGRTLTKRDFAAERYDEVLARMEDILQGPCQHKLRAALEETAKVLEDMQTLVAKRHGNVQRLQTEAVDAVTSGLDPEQTVTRLRSAFKQVLDVMERDARDLGRMSKTDALTDLNNRRALDEFLDDLVASWVVNPFPASLFMIDIDHFKKFNDTYGHRVGDQALITVARLVADLGKELAERTPPTEYFAARYGGEEFVVVLPRVELARAAELAEELRARIEAHRLVLRNPDGSVLEKGISLTVSVGVAAMDERWQGAHAANLIEAADKGLYEAKGSGRNRVCVRAPQP
ncbi:MAG: GGDEF domain-containing protein [Desulfovibrionaceae bacterium]|jgi:diguanylate cyclase (GGDEF)-like protein|nr:GGDEF domain-containing protein [Desulfovibrionaceae bacterium]